MKTKPVALERVFRPLADVGVPLCIVDFRVYLWRILQQVGTFADALQLPPHPKQPEQSELLAQYELQVAAWNELVTCHELFADWARASWALLLNRGPDMLPRPEQGYRLIVVDDSKLDGNYWRTLQLPSYKGTRGVRHDCYQRLYEAGSSLVSELQLPYYAQPLYEADDWAGLVYRLKLAAEPGSLLAQRECYLSTVDSDWLQLVHDAARIYWANTGPWQSRLKNEAETRAYVLKRMGVRIEHPRDIAAVKQRVGDSADNLPVGTNLALFDLTLANEQYCLDSLPDAARLLADLSAPDANTRTDVLQKSTRWLSAKGLPFVCS